MEKISELITKKILKKNDEIKNIFFIKNKYIILSYDARLEIYQKSFLKYIDINPFPKKSPLKINEITDIETNNNYFIIAITTNLNDIFLYQIMDKSNFKLLQIMQGNILYKLRNKNRFIKFYKMSPTNYSYSIYSKEKTKFNKLKDKCNEIQFKSHFEEFIKTIINNNKQNIIVNEQTIIKLVRENVINKIRQNILNLDYYGIFGDNYETERYINIEECYKDITIIKILKLSDNKIIIITKEDNKQSWKFYAGICDLYSGHFKCNFCIYNIILYDINTGEKKNLYNKEIICKVEEKIKDDYMGIENYTFNINVVHSFDSNIINNNDSIFYINICYSRNESPYKLVNDFIIYNINKNSFVKYNLKFKEFYSDLEIQNLNNKIVYKTKTNFYFIYGWDFYEFKITKNGIQKLFFYSFNENNIINNNLEKYNLKLKGKNLYIKTSNYLYIFRLKN